MELRKGGELVVQTLEKLGVDHIFGIPGIHNLDIYDYLMNSSITNIASRHEQGAGFMADGYARISGKPGVALVITGPGLTNIITAMGQAYHDSIPMLVISSQIETSALHYRSGYLHELKNSTQLVSSVSKESRRIEDHSMIEGAISQAYHLALSGRPGPVHVEIPLDILGSEQRVSRSNAFQGQKEPVLSPGFIRETVQKIMGSKAPVILAGGGAVNSGREITRMAEKLSAPVLMTCAGKGVVSEDHPLSLGSRMHFPVVQKYLEQSDLVIALGTEFSPTDFWKRNIQMGKELICVNLDPASFYNQRTCNIGIEGDVTAVVQALLDSGLDNRGDRHRVMEDVSELKEKCTLSLEEVTGMGMELPSMISALGVIRECLPDDGTLWTDMTSPAYVGISEFSSPMARSFLHPVGFGTLGMALPAAIGSKTACPEKAVCVLAGDGGFQFTLPELAVAAELGISLPVIVWNDCGYGEIRRNQISRHPDRTIAVDHKGLDYTALAKAYGIKGETVYSLDDLSSVLARAFWERGPTLIEIKVEELSGI